MHDIRAIRADPGNNLIIVVGNAVERRSAVSGGSAKLGRFGLRRLPIDAKCLSINASVSGGMLVVNAGEDGATVPAAPGASAGRRGPAPATRGRGNRSRGRRDARERLGQHDDADDGEGRDDHEAHHAAVHGRDLGEGERCLPVAAEAASEAFAAASFSEPAEPAHEHRVIREGLRPVDDAMKQLMITRRGDAEALADRALLLTALLPPRALELEDVERALIELRSASPGGVPCPVTAHVSRLTTSQRSASRHEAGVGYGKSPRVL